MSEDLDIVVLFPRHLNLNGDLANAGVLAKRAGWYGIDVAVTLIDFDDEMPESTDLIILGHGSANAWSQIAAEGSKQLTWLYAQIDRDVPVLSLASGYEFLARRGCFGGDLATLTAVNGERRSEFAVFEAELFGERRETLGYLNSKSQLPLVAQNGSLLGTLLHGPFLAKNPEVADQLLAKLSANTLAPGSEQSLTQLRRVGSLVEQIWKLERPA